MARRANAVAALPRRLASNPYCELLYDHVAKLGVDVPGVLVSIRMTTFVG